MNGIRFVHTDDLRLGGSIAGLAAAPDWLRRLARDSTRGAVSKVFDIASTRNADFVFIGGSCTECDEFRSSVRQWLEKPLRWLRQQGIRIVMAASPLSETEHLADFVVHPNERLYVTRSTDGVRFEICGPTDLPKESDLALSPESVGISTHVTCNYLFSPQLRHTVRTTQDKVPVYSAGAPQSHSPQEQGEFGCLVVNAIPGTGQMDVAFEPTDPLRFEIHKIDSSSVVTSQDVCDVIVTKSRILARQQRRSTVVDWHFETPLECAGEIESWPQETILNSVRTALQEGHLGVWPRRIEMDPSSVLLAGELDSAGERELTSLLFEQQRESKPLADGLFSELVTGARLLRRAA